jgi:HEPN domain-containing protein
LKPPEEVRREFARQWLRKGAKDLASAQRLLGGGEEFAYGGAFYAQQAAEKFLKAVLIWHQVEFPKTHDIGRLVDLVQTKDGVLADLTREATALTPYGVDVRYPGEVPEPTLDEAKAAVGLADIVRKAVLSRLPRELRPR